jgi:hypothetical protein
MSPNLTKSSLEFEVLDLQEKCIFLLFDKNNNQFSGKEEFPKRLGCLLNKGFLVEN